ncbi:MAG: putative ABC transporter permease [Candidatus Saccharibacteria bacterium]|nr:putative ABC transporter permease [Candidatus Saccharibacteria bacterium]
MEESPKNEQISILRWFLVFLVGGVGGVIIETIFCFLTAGIWMNRSSLLYTPISLVWGLGLLLFVMLLQKIKLKSISLIFGAGMILGGAFEYLCSLVTEWWFGVVFWDYSGMIWNLGGRINLLYCMFWGLIAVLYIKLLQPKLQNWLSRKGGKISETVMLIIMVWLIFDITMTAAVLIRFEERRQCVSQQKGWLEWLDQKFDDDYVESRWPNIIRKK